MRIVLALIIALATGIPAQADVNIKQVLKTEERGLRNQSKARLGGMLKAPEGGVEYSRASLDNMPKASGGKQWRCLSEALYFEARGESVKGQFAVAEVIMNRVNSSRFPDTVCGVIHQGTGRKFACQFTYTCDGHKEVISEPKAFQRVAKVARAVLDGAPRSLTAGATYYHTKAVRPSWSRKFARTTTIGVHHFYRHPKEVAHSGTVSTQD